MTIGSRSDEAAKTVTAERIIAGTCPECGIAVAVLNWHEAWPLVFCPCGWRGATTEIRSAARFVRQIT